MNLLYKLVEFLNKIKTAYRRINHPEIKCGDLIIDIGSGGNPNPRADIACDFIDENMERSDVLKIDRMFIWCNAEYLPFKDKIFDYSIVSHVLEHINKPEEALLEIQRISKAGYIETPNAFYEFAIPHIYHLSRCTVINNKLIIFKKERWDETINEKYFDVKHDMNKCWWDLHRLNALALLTIYRWENKIDYEIYGNKFFVKPQEIMKECESLDNRSFFRKFIIKLIYLILKSRKKLNLQKLLACPICKGDLKIEIRYKNAECLSCGILFKQYKGFLDFGI